MKTTNRRHFLKSVFGLAAASVSAAVLSILPGVVRTSIGSTKVQPEPDFTAYNPREHLYSYIIDLHKCIGCGSCVQACKRENEVPTGFFRTWVERYQAGPTSERAHIDSPNGGLYGFPAATAGVSGVSKAYFVPKMCNHCSEAPCVQVCPFGASYKSPDGVMLVDRKRCMGCGYCVQACPYAARWINPVNHVADKCTWCYHRVTKGLKPACVQACPTNTRSFGDTRNLYDPINSVLTEQRIGVLQPHLLTKPKCYYIGLDKEVR
jgi:tetrathionate reductase subunit B